MDGDCAGDRRICGEGEREQGGAYFDKIKEAKRTMMQCVGK